MKIVSNNFRFVIIFLFGCTYAFAGSSNNGPPAPTAKQNAVAIDPTPPPGLSIDENIFILLVVALLFGTYIIYLSYIKTKNTI